MKKQAKILAIILALAFVLAVPGLATACGPRWQEKPYETIAQGAVSHYGYGVSDGTTLVIKAEVEWSDFWNVHTGGMLPQPPAPEVNFHHDMVLVAIAGTRATTGYSISFESLYERQRGHVTLANYREMAPGANCPVGQMTTNPYHIIVTEKSRTTTFHQLPTEVYMCFDTVDQGVYSGYPSDVDGDYFVIRDDAAWTDFWTVHKSFMFPQPEMPEIDFGNEMVVCAFHGTYPNNGAGVSIQGISSYGDHWEVEVTRATGDGILPTVTNPYHIVKTLYTDLPVEFDVTEVEM